MKEQIIIVACLALGACSSDRESFSSEPGEGFGWKSMSENHKRIQGLDYSNLQEVKAPVIQSTPYHISTGPWTDVERIPEKYLRIWFPPYQDAQGNLHEEHAIHTVIQSGQWIIPGHTETNAS